VREAVIALVVFICLLIACFGTLDLYARLPGKYGKSTRSIRCDWWRPSSG
jgi:hypothetical protein